MRYLKTQYRRRVLCMFHCFLSLLIQRRHVVAINPTTAYVMDTTVRQRENEQFSRSMVNPDSSRVGLCFFITLFTFHAVTTTLLCHKKHVQSLTLCHMQDHQLIEFFVSSLVISFDFFWLTEALITAHTRLLLNLTCYLAFYFSHFNILCFLWTSK